MLRIQTIIVIWMLCAFPCFALAHTANDASCKDNPHIIQKPIIFDAKRIALTQAYRKVHYGIASKSITILPKMIVLHWTAIPPLAKSFAYFNHSTLGHDRPEIGKPGDLNVSAHFLVDTDGHIYQLMPTDWMARHIVGLNPIAIGIENVGGVDSKEDLTKEQIEANADLVCFLKKQYPSIQYLIGHFEYEPFRNTPLWQEKNKSYYTQKDDPGQSFMKAVRARVAKLGLYSRP